MIYFKTLGAIKDLKAGRVSSSIAVQEQKGVATEQSVAFQRIKDSWPRCGISVRQPDGSFAPTGQQGYLYTFASGVKQCTKAWNQDAYAMVVLGTSPIAPPPDLSKVAEGSEEYFRWLVRAQGDGRTNKNIQNIRIGFDRAGISWKPTGDVRMRALSPPYDSTSRPKPEIQPHNMAAAIRFIRKDGGNPGYWRNRAYRFSLDQQEILKKEVTKEHRASKCAERVPPEFVAACEDALNRKDGTSIEDFLDQLEDLTPDQLAVIAGGTRGGFPSVYYYGAAAVIVGVVALLALKKKK